MTDIALGLGELNATNEKGAVLRTHALGSCIAVIILDTKTRTAGMVHIVLPSSQTNPDKAMNLPGYFADTGIPALLREMAALGCSENGRGKIVKLAGGAQIMDPHNVFNVGKRNLLAVKKVLWRYRLGAVAEDVGGTISRTVRIDLGRGKIFLSSPGRQDWEL